MPDPPSGGSSPLREASSRLCEVIREIHGNGWCQGTGGNFSVCLGREPLRLLITQSGRDKGKVAVDDLLLVDANGCLLEGGTGRPSAEALLHCSIASQTGCGAVLHTHSIAGTLLSEHFLAAAGFAITGYEMLKGLAGISTHEATLRVPIIANDQNIVRLSKVVSDLLVDRSGLHGFLIAGHGLYTWGQGLGEAHRHVEILEFLFECVARRVRFAPFVADVH